MFKTSTEPRLVTFSTTAYRLLLTFYPNRFRREYGPDMAQVFRDCCLKSYRQSGLPGMLSLWALTLFDWFKSVLDEQLNLDTEMTRTKFIRLSGWGMVLAAVSLLLSFLPEAEIILEGLYQTFGAPATSAQHDLYQSLSEGVRSLPFPVAILLITLGLLGLFIGYGEQAGKTAKMALGIGVLGGAAGLVINVWMILGLENGRPPVYLHLPPGGRGDRAPAPDPGAGARHPGGHRHPGRRHGASFPHPGRTPGPVSPVCRPTPGDRLGPDPVYE